MNLVSAMKHYQFTQCFNLRNKFDIGKMHPLNRLGSFDYFNLFHTKLGLWQKLLLLTVNKTAIHV